jgi:hypothetical protein
MNLVSRACCDVSGFAVAHFSAPSALLRAAMAV